MATYAPTLRSATRQQQDHIQDLLQRWAGMKTQRELYLFDWQEIVRLLIPGHDDIADLLGREPGQSRTSAIFDSQPLLAPQTLAANIMGAVTNPAVQWFRLKFRDEALNESQAVNQWLESCDTRMTAAYSASTFYQAAHTFYLNLGGFGTAAMWAGSRLGFEGRHLHFRTLPTGSYCIAENADGLVDTLFREMWLTPRQAIQLFEGQVSDQMKAWADSPTEQDKPRCILHCVYPRTDRDRERMDNRNMPFAGVYLEVEQKFLNDETGYEEFPYIVSRWETMSKAPYGFGPGHIALPDVRMLNVLRELHLQQMALWVQPPLKALQEGIIGSISLESRAVNVVRQMDALQTLDLTGRPDLIQIDQADLRRSIQDCFFVNALQALPPPDASNMTAYEVSARIEQMQRLMGPAFSRLLAEMLDPLADRVFGLMLRARALPQPPQEVFLAARQTGGQLDVEYEGPLARSQRGADVRAFEQTIALAGQIVGVHAQVGDVTHALEILDNVDLDAGFRNAARIYGVPRANIVDMRQVTALRAARAQQAAQQQQVAQTNETMGALGKLGPLAQAMQRQPAALAA